MGFDLVLALVLSIASAAPVFAGYSSYAAEMYCGMTLTLPDYDSPLIVTKSDADVPLTQENCELSFKTNRSEYGVVAWLKDVNLRTNDHGCCLDYVQIEYNGKRSNQICLESHEVYISPPHMENDFKITFHKNLTESLYEANFNESDFNFHLVLTQFKQGSCNPKKDFFCVTDGRCISLNLRCDHINNCGDNTDEGCPDSYSRDLTLPIAVTLMIASIFFISVFVCIAKRIPAFNKEPRVRYVPSAYSAPEHSSYGTIPSTSKQASRRYSADLSESKEKFRYQKF